MKRKWAVVMNGRNFLIALNGKQSKLGFYQRFFLEADTPQDAEMAVVGKVRKDKVLRALSLNKEDDPPTLHIDKIREMANFRGIMKKTSGKAFYSEENEGKRSNQRPSRTVAPRQRRATCG